MSVIGQVGQHMQPNTRGAVVDIRNANSPVRGRQRRSDRSSRTQHLEVGCAKLGRAERAAVRGNAHSSRDIDAIMILHFGRALNVVAQRVQSRGSQCCRHSVLSKGSNSRSLAPESVASISPSLRVEILKKSAASAKQEELSGHAYGTRNRNQEHEPGGERKLEQEWRKTHHLKIPGPSIRGDHNTQGECKKGKKGISKTRGNNS